MSTTQLRAAELQAEEIDRLWDAGLTGRQIGERLGLAPRAVNKLLRVTRSDPPRRTWTWLAGPKRIAALVWLNQKRPTMSIDDLSEVTGRSPQAIRRCLKEDLNQWSEKEKADALQQFPDPFDTGTVPTAERHAWQQVVQHEVPLPGRRGAHCRKRPVQRTTLSELDPSRHQLGLVSTAMTGAARAHPHAEAPTIGLPAAGAPAIRPVHPTVSTRPLVDVTLFSTKNHGARSSRPEQVRSALTAWHLRHERHFTTAEVAYILGRSASAVGHYLRQLKPSATRPRTGGHRANADDRPEPPCNATFPPIERP
ncbi:hypothetical protein [Crossiella cryophila]|uniref:Putative transcriptional regulator n=1 Tax=Crossiella cryophila TaxID=43355 RepID=A0A7W7CE10_9PSEU|nr:hypothetical protein [Crossiella cryophila]MBB4679423.1 putative transcriptional regulator [Crossiella cryophila]